MRIIVHVGMDQCGASRIQDTLANKRDQLSSKGILYPTAAGRTNHTRLYMAVSDPENVDVLRHNRGTADPEAQATFREKLSQNLESEIDKHAPETLILSASQLCWLSSPSELKRLQDLLTPFSDDITIVAHVDDQARVMARVFADQVTEGRRAPLTREVEMVGPNWAENALALRPDNNPDLMDFAEIQAPPHWLDYKDFILRWGAVFGEDKVVLRPYDEELFAEAGLINEIRTTFDIRQNIGKAKPEAPKKPLPAAFTTRIQQLNQDLHLLLQTGRKMDRQLYRRILRDIAINGPAINPANLNEISKGFANGNTALVKKNSDLKDALKADRKGKSWETPAPERGFRARQYLAACLPAIDKFTRDSLRAERVAARKAEPENAKAKPEKRADGLDENGIGPIAKALMNKDAIENFVSLKGGSFAPHNNVGKPDETELGPEYAHVEMRKLPKSNSGNVIVGCMKNEAPYIVEWVAYHRAIGVDNFLIYTNGCDDGTSEILDHLQEMGVVQHRNNDNWKGNSPQQYALNQSLKEPLIKNAEWVIHIDVDEFMNIRTGNGTMQDLLDAVPDATNIAMTWRLFGYSGVTELSNDLVIEQFDQCAPKHCPKPHTVWGFKTMFKNIGAYEKISCHRPNKLIEGFEKKVNWVNGSGKPMGGDYETQGWRSSKGNIGYDLITLNHYALRSAESYMIKRQRGRALHVDRSIGINYWIRMDWSDHTDLSIRRNLPRVRSEYDRLMGDAKLAGLHAGGCAWHRAKATELHGMPEFEDLYQQALKIKLTAMERVAYALSLDLES